MRYTGAALKEISFPLGGIGTGCIGLAGNGRLIDWEIFGKPAKGSINGYTFLAVRAKCAGGREVIRILHSDEQKEFVGHFSKGIYCGYGYGPNKQTMCGFPHFKNLVFEGDFPIAKLIYEDEEFPGRVVLTAFNPMIPLNSADSSIPAAFFRISIENGAEDAEYTVVFAVQNPYNSSVNEPFEKGGMSGVYMKCADKSADEIGFGNLTIASDRSGIRQAYWYRGGWQDGIATFWHEFSHGALSERNYENPGRNDVCTVGCSCKIPANGADSVRFVLSWSTPLAYNYWKPVKDEAGRDRVWKNFYATVFETSLDSALYALSNFDSLYEKTLDFKNALWNSSLPKEVIDAAASTMSVLKSPTVLRLEDGSFYGWEGVHEEAGSCEGTCAHVWSYAYALCFLFPDLERSIRENELKYCLQETGALSFRMPLPRDRERYDFRMCVDGQTAEIFKVYREWKISGDDEWLKSLWQDVKKALAFAWNADNPHKWDLNKDGVLEGRQHHTLDMELFGPSAWLQGMYFAALRAAEEMAEYLGDPDAEMYRAIFESGYDYVKNNLFNGSHFIQKVDLADRSVTEEFNCPEYWNAEKGELKYQIGEGSEIDQMLGQWHANILGLGDVFDPVQKKTALENMFKNNFKPTMRSFANPWRIYSLNDEAGAVICDYPEGAYKPVIPVPYCEETMHGFEYAFAGLLISEGFAEEGLRVVRSVRDRYDGEKRNPFNEIECGSNYARSMASFALLPILSGFEFDLPHGHIGFNPILPGEFKAPFSLGTGWGEFVKTESHAEICMHSGSLSPVSIALRFADKVLSVKIDGKEVPFAFENGCVKLENACIAEKAEIEYR